MWQGGCTERGLVKLWGMKDHAAKEGATGLGGCLQGRLFKLRAVKVHAAHDVRLVLQQSDNIVRAEVHVVQEHDALCWPGRPGLGLQGFGAWGFAHGGQAPVLCHLLPSFASLTAMLLLQHT